jgi:hypothetical protein
LAPNPASETGTAVPLVELCFYSPSTCIGSLFHLIDPANAAAGGERAERSNCAVNARSEVVLRLSTDATSKNETQSQP